MGAKGPVVVEQLVMAGTVEELLLGMHEKNAEKSAEEIAEKSAEEIAEKSAEEGATCPFSPLTPAVSKSARKRPVGEVTRGGAVQSRTAKRGHGLFSAVRGWLSGEKAPGAEGAIEGGEEAAEDANSPSEMRGRPSGSSDQMVSVGGLLGSITFLKPPAKDP